MYIGRVGRRARGRGEEVRQRHVRRMNTFKSSR